jgi:hypothetical protein
MSALEWFVYRLVAFLILIAAGIVWRVFQGDLDHTSKSEHVSPEKFKELRTER